MFRKDRKSGGGGVFILLREDIEYNENAFENCETDCEIVWAQIKLPGSKLLNIASMYRPPNSKLELMEKLHDHLTTVYSKSKNGMYIIGGDMNLTCIDWEREIILTEQTNSTRDLNHCTKFLETISEIGVSQHCKITTRPISGKILDLMLTNRPDTVIDVSVYPGMSDHNIVIGTFNLITSRTRKPQGKFSNSIKQTGLR